MAKIVRKTSKIFANSASNNGQFGSAQTGTKVLSNDVAVLQNLAAYDTGWLQAVISGQRLPTLEEMQALFYILSYQESYLFQEGISEWDSGTTYYLNSIVKKTATFQLYGSLVDNNTNNALPAAVDNSNWKYLGDLSNPVSFSSNTVSNTGTSTNTALTPANFGTQNLLTSNGYQKLPGGLIIQWGLTTAIALDTSLAITFPILFPNNVLNAQATLVRSGGTNPNGTAATGVLGLTTSGMSIINDVYAASGGGAYPAYWLAIGN